MTPGAQFTACSKRVRGLLGRRSDGKNAAMKNVKA
jgi:hypothetical protein